jgi:RNA-directed DNA polymerase
MSLQTPEKIRQLQRKLYLKAKTEPSFRFYLLYDKVHRPDILEHAYLLAKANGGAAGVDGVTFDDIEKSGRGQWLTALGGELRGRTYRPQPVRRVMIPKPGGGERPLGIPTIRDRVAQTAAKLVLEPIFEADFSDAAFGYRPDRSAQDAVRQVHQAIRDGYTDVVDADLSRYFDTIPHKELMRSVARRVVDRHMLRLVRMWLKVPVEERDERGNRRMSGGKRSKTGTPQGGVVSPLLANIYFNRFLRHWERQGMGQKLRAKVINYADDFVIVSCGADRAAGALAWTRRVMAGLGLKLNESKTCVRDVRRERFDFLGYTFGKVYHVHEHEGKHYLAACPSDKSVRRLKQKLHAALAPWNTGPWDEVAARVNRMLRGWSNYFSYGTLKRAYRAVDNHVFERVRHCLRRRHKLHSGGSTLLPSGKCLGRWGVERLRERFMHLRGHTHALG